jgi:hypothetical protein
LGKVLFNLGMVCGLLLLLPWTEAKPAQFAAAAASPPAHAAEILAAHERGPTPLLDDLRELCDGTDNFAFLISGVPNLIARQEWAPYLPSYHAETDVYEAVNPQEARNNAALAAALVWGLAENPDRPATRQTHAEVEKLLRNTKLDEQMKSVGQWDDWVTGKRGVSQ